MDIDRQRGLGIVMAGGAARGAYQAGVLRFLFTELPKNLGYCPWPDVVSGTSVGGLNGVFAAARDPESLKRLRKIWTNLQIHDIYRFRVRDALRFLRAPFRSSNVFHLLDGDPLQNLIEREFPSAALRRAIGGGKTRAFILSATDLASGQNTLFFDGGSSTVLVDPMPQVRVERTEMRPIHLLASASIPFLFRPVFVNGRWLVDGGLRMNTPLRPALRVGVDRALVISLMQGDLGGAGMKDALPNLVFLAGKTFNALMLDPVERDLHIANKLNHVVRWGRERFGNEFETQVRKELDVRHVDTFFLRPSEDIGCMAAQIFRSSPPKVDLPLRYLLARVGDSGSPLEADLLSYMLFDRAFTGELERLGFEDARRAEEHLVALIEPKSSS